MTSKDIATETRTVVSDKAWLRVQMRLDMRGLLSEFIALDAEADNAINMERHTGKDVWCPKCGLDGISYLSALKGEVDNDDLCRDPDFLGGWSCFDCGYWSPVYKEIMLEADRLTGDPRAQATSPRVPLVMDEFGLLLNNSPNEARVWRKSAAQLGIVDRAEVASLRGSQQQRPSPASPGPRSIWPRASTGGDARQLCQPSHRLTVGSPLVQPCHSEDSSSGSSTPGRTTLPLLRPNLGQWPRIDDDDREVRIGQTIRIPRPIAGRTWRAVGVGSRNKIWTDDSGIAAGRTCCRRRGIFHPLFQPPEPCVKRHCSPPAAARLARSGPPVPRCVPGCPAKPEVRGVGRAAT
jgi:hypothetical protein